MDNYSEKINIPNNPFGIEIEFAGIQPEKVYNELKRLLKNIIICENYKKGETEDYTCWCVKDDITVQIHEKDIEQKLGGEITTPIMYNEKEFWQELKLVCETIRKISGIKINDYCSIHIHTDKHIYSSIKEYINLLKLWMVYEDIIYRFGYGEKKEPRILITKYAKPISYYIFSILDKLEKIETEEELVKLLKYDRTLGLNLLNIIRLKQTIENRIYNGTLDETLIQDIILFNQNLLGYAKTENFDEEFIGYKIKTYTPLFINDSLIGKESKERELINLIIRQESDRQKLLCRYK